MRSLLLRFWREEAGVVLAADWVLMATILVLGLIIAAATVRATLPSERALLQQD